MRRVKPTAYIGPVGSLVPFLGPSTQSVSGGREVSFQNTLGKRKAFLGQVRAREWSCELDTRYPEELSGLQYIADYGTPPFVWYPADALFGNMLPPDVAALAPGTHSGLAGPVVEVEPGVWVASVFPDGTSAVALNYRDGVLEYVPVIPGGTVTVSAWLRGATTSRGQVISVIWRDHDGVALLTDNPTVGEETSSLVRREMTVTAPPGAVQASLHCFAGQVAGPAVTLGDRLLPYSPGKGAPKTVVHGLSESIKLVSQYPQGHSLSGLSFTVSEVG